MRNRIWGVALAAAAFIMAAASPAMADNYPVRDGTGATQTFCSKLSVGLQYPCHLLYGMFGSTPTPITSDGSNLNVHVQASELPTGAATAANQTTANTSLGQIVSNTTGGATATNQTATQANAGSDASKAIAIQGVTGGKAIPTNSTPVAVGSTTDRSITVTTGGTAQQVMAANASRRSFYVFNPMSTDTCWASFTTTTPAANAKGSFPLSPYGGFGMETSATTAALYAVCPTTSDVLTAWESQ